MKPMKEKPIIKGSSLWSLPVLCSLYAFICVYAYAGVNFILNGKPVDFTGWYYELLLLISLISVRVLVYRDRVIFVFFFFVFGNFKFENIYSIEAFHWIRIPLFNFFNNINIIGKKDLGYLQYFLFYYGRKSSKTRNMRVFSHAVLFWMLCGGYHKILKYLVLNTPIETKISTSTLQVLGLSRKEVIDIKKNNPSLAKIIIPEENRNLFVNLPNDDDKAIKILSEMSFY